MIIWVRIVIMKRNFKIPKKEQYGHAREMLGYYPNKDNVNIAIDGDIIEDE